ncbi:filamentous hemagglutinin N-terminal domain-containing protein [Nostoc sp. C110]|uniref:filamentous hemagglutinin N-terminal domain-containing protein n=1 Tax=Nostoc sp. C110 TaxID=3349876 RepID=UPI00370DDBBF
MKATSLYLGLIGGILTGAMIFPANAQVTPDGTTHTIVNSSGNNFNILNGIEKGNNLFHSFSNFSVPTGGSATFDLINTPNITTIFSRVTGRNVSNIDGLIQTLNGNHPASLFLMNPNGIIFGQNASLNIGGSFIGTTAESINFADGFKFSVADTTTPPLLTISIPIGLQLGKNSGSINIQGQGHNYLHQGNFIEPINREPQLGGLSVLPGKTLALIGNEIRLDGGILVAQNGQIKLGSVNGGTVNLDTNSANWKLDYAPVQNFSDIHLTGAALIDASGNPGGSIHLQAKAIQIQDSSAVFIQHQGMQNAGRIEINTDFLELSGALPNKDQSLILSENLSSQQGANIDISARQVLARDGGLISSTTYQNGGVGGSISINAAESIQFSRFSPFDASRTSGILAPSYKGGGRGGNILLTTQDVLVKDGAVILAGVFGGNGGGNININSGNISLIGENSGTSGASALAATSFFGGDAGAIAINTNQLLLKAGGVISASTSGSGDAGSLTINAGKSVEIDGSGSILSQPSRITASGQQLPPVFRRIFGLTALPSGDGGNLSIKSPNIKVSNQGYIAAENVGSGDAGYLQIQANSLTLERKGQIITSTKVGQGGSLELSIKDLLLMRNNSLISAKAEGQGNGGNIIINSPVIVGLENSDIIANAVIGSGGNIKITTQGIFGLEFRNQLTPENDITASSQFGISGTVQVNNIGVDPNSGLIELPANVTEPSQKIATGCADTSGSSFIATGRGGIPQNPSQEVSSDRTWSDIRNLSAFHKTQALQTQIPVSPEILVQATSWHRNAQGKIELVAAKSPTNMRSPLTCTATVSN